MKLPRLAATRPVTVSMLVFVAVLMGGVALTRLSVDLLPEMNIPVAAVATTYEGAGPSEVETLISRPIEEVVTAASNVKKVSSTSSRGQSVVIAEFDWGTDMNFATLDLREKVDMVRPFLPTDAGTPRVLTFDPSSAPVLELGMTGQMDTPRLRELAEDVVKNRLERIAGVASVRVLGGQETQVQVRVDAGLMRTYGVPFEHIVQTLRAANLNLPGGRIDVGMQEVTIRTTGEYSSLDQIKATPIPAASGTVPLGQIASITMGHSDIDIHSRLNDQPGIWLEVMKETGANTVTVIDDVQAALTSLQNELGDGVTFVTVSDESRYIRGSLSSVSENAILGGLLAMVVLFVFLRNMRTTIIIGTAIPISVIFTFFLIYMSGMTLNMMSLGGLALGIGMLVDNGIVVIENIFRHRVAGKNALDAADAGTTEVGTAIIASTITTVSVFVPVVFIEGLASQIFRDLSLSVTFSLLASLIVSVTLIPMLATKLLGNLGGAKSMAGVLGEEAVTSSPSTAAQNNVAGTGRGMYAAYARTLRALISRPGLLYTGLIVALGLSVALIPLIGLEFMPPFDEGQVEINVEMPKGTRLEETNRVIMQVEQLVQGLPDIESVLATAGADDAPDVGRVSIHMVPKKDRQGTSDDLVRLIRQRTREIPGAKMSIASSSGFMSGFGDAPVQIEVHGSDMATLRHEAQRIAALIESVRGVQDVSMSDESGRPELQLHVDRDKASRLGLTVAQIAGAVRTAVQGETATIYRHDGQEIDIVVRLQSGDLTSVNDLHQIPVGTPFGIIPLSEVATMAETIGPVAINRTDQSRAIAITANIADRDLGAVMSDIRAQVALLNFPADVEVAYGGEDQQMREAFGDLGLALVLAIILVYAVLASQFESLVQPFVILFTIPFSFIGVIVGLLIFRHTLNVAAIVGVIMLAGIAVNNAIVLIDFINQRRAEGMDRLEAVIEAGRTRLRPILMTTLTTVLGMVPLLFGLGEGSEVMAPLAAVVVCGLITATFLTLTVIPSLYLTFDGWADKLKQAVGKRRSTESPSQPVAERVTM